MANTFTNRLKKRLPAAGDPNWDDEWNDNGILDEVVMGALLGGDRVISGGEVTDGGGLTANYAAIVGRLNGAPLSVDAGSLAMSGAAAGTDAAGNVLTVANWIYVNSSGVAATSLTPPSGDYIPLAMVDASNTAILRIADLRPIAEAVVYFDPPVAVDIGKALTVMPDLSLSYQPANRGRKNHIIDGNFDIWLEATSQTTSGYGSDTMWLNEHSGTTKVHSRQAFTPGQTLVPGNPEFFSRTVVTSVAGASNYCRKSQRIERVKTNAGNKATYSFYFDTDVSKNIAVEFVQNFGTGGSPSTEITAIGTQLVAVTPGFKKYYVTVNLPSMTGKTVGTNNNDYLGMVFWYDAGTSFNTRAANLGQQSGTFDLAQVQLEDGEVATEYEEQMPGEPLRDVNRYYEAEAPIAYLTTHYGNTTIGAYAYERSIYIGFKQTKRAAPAVTTVLNVGTAAAAIGKISGILVTSTWATETNVVTLNSWTADSRL